MTYIFHAPDSFSARKVFFFCCCFFNYYLSAKKTVQYIYLASVHLSVSFSAFVFFLFQQLIEYQSNQQ